MKRAPNWWQISTSPMSASIGEQFWKPKKTAVLSLRLAARMSSAKRPGMMRS